MRASPAPSKRSFTRKYHPTQRHLKPPMSISKKTLLLLHWFLCSIGLTGILYGLSWKLHAVLLTGRQAIAFKDWATPFFNANKPQELIFFISAGINLFLYYLVLLFIIRKREDWLASRLQPGGIWEPQVSRFVHCGSSESQRHCLDLVSLRSYAFTPCNWVCIRTPLAECPVVASLRVAPRSSRDTFPPAGAGETLSGIGSCQCLCSEAGLALGRGGTYRARLSPACHGFSSLCSGRDAHDQ